MTDIQDSTIDTYAWSEKIEAVAHVIKNQKDVDELLWEICGVVLDIFDCDRAWLLFPCDPAAPTWSVPIERTRPAYPGANLGGMSIEMTSDVAEIFQTALSSSLPTVYGSSGLPLAENTRGYQVQSQLSMAIYPRSGKPWQFGIHQCSHGREWSQSEIRLFHIIGIMTAEALGNSLLVHSLREANDSLEQRIEERTAELIAEKKFAESLIDTAQAIVLVLDTKGRIVRFNPYMEELCGYALAEVRNKDWFEKFLPVADRAAIRAKFKEALNYSRTHNNVNPILTKSGTERQIGWFYNTLTDSDGEALGVLAIGQDITERLRIEHDLRQAKEQAERANAAKSRFLAAASHDLRQPLQALSLLFSALSAQRLDQTCEQIVDDMKAALQVTESLLNALLDISKLEARFFIPNRKSFPVALFLQGLRGQFKAQAEKKGVRIRVFPSDAVLYTDVDLFSRIVQNFVANAIHYGHGGRILIGCRRAGRNWRIEVWDRGPGIPAEYLEKIFEEFFQIGNPARDLNRGLGLGLAIAKRVADLLQLKLSVKSRPGRGSVFSVEVPSGHCLPMDPSGDAYPAAEAGSRKGWILVVDDDAIVLNATERLLTSWGYAVSCAPSAESALELIRQHSQRYLLALLDYRLPDNWNGVTLYSQFEAVLGRPLPTIILTGDTSAEKLREVKETNLPVLHKPIDTSELYRLIMNCAEIQNT